MQAKKIRVADYIAARCSAAGARHVFLVTGGGAMHLNDAFGRHAKLSPVCFHHEQGAAIAAEGYFRVSNRLAVLNVTTGPGGINALNGVYGAYVDSLGMLVISGQVKRETFLRNYPQPMRQLGDQEVDIVSMARPITKYATVLQDPLQVRKSMDKAIFLATYGRPGPVWVDVPVDVQGALIDPEILEGWDSTNLAELVADPDLSPNTLPEILQLGRQPLEPALDEILARLTQAKRPVIFAGNGVRISGMTASFLDLVARLQIPVVTGWNAHDILTNDNACYAGRPGTVGDRAGNFSVQNADFVLVLGCRLNIRQISYNWKSFAAKAWKAMVDADLAELDKPTLSLDLKVHSDLSVFIPALLRLLDGYSPRPEHKQYLQWCRDRVQKYPTVLPEYRRESAPFNPYHFVEELFTQLTEKDVVVTGNGSACVIGFQAAQLTKGQRLFTNSGNASMGYDLPAAIGACLARGGQQRVICLAGDGSLMMNLQELQTLVGYKLPVKVLVLNNAGYHSIRQTQQAYFSDNLIGIGPESGVSLPDFVALGNALGIPSVAVRSAKEWRNAAVQGLLELQGPALIEVFVDVDQPFAPKLASRKLDDGTMVSPSLEDMAPFLSPDEMSKNTVA
jgi:acetolactate synthase-1/2/3 large subunit